MATSGLVKSLSGSDGSSLKTFGYLETYPVHNQIHGLVLIELCALVTFFKMDFINFSTLKALTQTIQGLQTHLVFEESSRRNVSQL